MMADESHDCSEMAKVPRSSASTSSSSKGVMINNNSGKQGDVFAHVQGDVITNVSGDVFTNLRVAGDFFTNLRVAGDLFLGDKKIQPLTLPRIVVLKTKYNGKYLRLTENDGGNEGFLKFDARERELASSLANFELERAKFELERAKSGHEFVHIRCCYNNKYWVRAGAKGFIVAAADKPEEDESKISCTLFKLEQVKKSGRVEFQFLHSQRKSYACVWRCWNCGPPGIQNHGSLYVGTDCKEAIDAYTVVAWESLAERMNEAVVQAVQLPKFVALKGLFENNEYLSLTTKSDPSSPAGFLQFKGKEVASPITKFEIEMATKSESGLVHIRCCENNKYLVRVNTTCTCCNKYYTKICEWCCDNSKYLMREHTTCTCCDNNNRKICDSCCDNPYFIVPAADKPEEDENKISSTLFEPEPYDESGELKFRFCHVHLGMRRYACMPMPMHMPMVNGVLYGGSNEPHKDACDVYKVVNLDGLG